ncbi:FAD-dependent oxidoreductase (plasmid) [Sagittula sp. P11]|uniref:NAD(P)/FAD-dependent oxidoreductase n=1 Tax=Sagittula sp. P11 TaxID=2009329 RepID=UPI000C2D0702|nr:FAD-binding oxidoreductase [Sagittula sp. P11]AUC56236.1 FAD-dependent oxidoreductase [Sagittula sp. P11]
MNRRLKCDVIVIGGGLFGAFTGLFLARAGLSVALLEKGQIGAQASATNFGNLRLHGRSARQYPLSIRAQELWEAYGTLTGEGCEIERTGHLYFAHGERGEIQLRKDVETATRFGVESQLLKKDALHARFGFLSRHIRLAAFSPRSAVANPRLSTPPVTRALARAGGTVIEGCEVAGFDSTATGFAVTSTDGRCFEAPRLVNAAGAWAGKLAQQAGEPVPMFSAGPPQFVTEPLPHRLHPSVHMVEGDVIVRQIPRGNIIFSGYPRTRSLPSGEFTYVPPAKTLRGMRTLVECIPMLARAEIIRVWSGVEGYLPDMLPVIGASTTTPGLFHAFGGSGGGFQIAPAVGECLAALVRGEASKVDISGYGIDRFTEGSEVSEKIHLEFDQ